MIAYLRGIVVEKTDSSLIIDVKGIGYQVFATMALLSQCEIGETVQVFTHFVVREDSQALYGFTDQLHLLLFKKLLTISGIGPKSGLAIMQAASLQEIIQAVQVDDHTILTQVSGIGPKTAKRVVLELKNKLDDFQIEATDQLGASYGVKADVLQALESLGYETVDIRSLLNEMNVDGLTSSEAIKQALKRLSEMR